MRDDDARCYLFSLWPPPRLDPPRRSTFWTGSPGYYVSYAHTPLEALKRVHADSPETAAHSWTGTVHAISCDRDLAYMGPEAMWEKWPEHFDRPWGAMLLEGDQLNPDWSDEGPMEIRYALSVLQYKVSGTGMGLAGDEVVGNTKIHPALEIAVNGRFLIEVKDDVESWGDGEDLVVTGTKKRYPVAVDHQDRYLVHWLFSLPPFESVIRDMLNRRPAKVFEYLWGLDDVRLRQRRDGRERLLR